MVSVPLAAVLGLTSQSISAVIFCFIGGVLIDLDHFIEYIIHRGLKTLNPRQIYQGCASLIKRSKNDIKKVHFIFHAAELALLLWAAFLFTKKIYFLSAACGYSVHLAMDMRAGTLRPDAYFLFTRIKNNFQTARLLRKA